MKLFSIGLDFFGSKIDLTKPSRIAHLKRQLQTLRQDAKPCVEYLQKEKSWAAPLAVMGKPVHDEDLIPFIISVLNLSYNAVITSFNFATLETFFSYDGFQVDLLSYETLLVTQRQTTPILDS